MKNATSCTLIINELIQNQNYVGLITNFEKLKKA
jgi:hypothetical protein